MAASLYTYTRSTADTRRSGNSPITLELVEAAPHAGEFLIFLRVAAHLPGRIDLTLGTWEKQLPIAPGITHHTLTIAGETPSGRGTIAVRITPHGRARTKSLRTLLKPAARSHQPQREEWTVASVNSVPDDAIEERLARPAVADAAPESPATYPGSTLEHADPVDRLVGEWRSRLVRAEDEVEPEPESPFADFIPAPPALAEEAPPSPQPPTEPMPAIDPPAEPVPAVDPPAEPVPAADPQSGPEPPLDPPAEPVPPVTAPTEPAPPIEPVPPVPPSEPATPTESAEPLTAAPAPPHRLAPLVADLEALLATSESRWADARETLIRTLETAHRQALKQALHDLDTQAAAHRAEIRAALDRARAQITAAD